MTHRDIRYEQISPQAYASALQEAGLPAEVVALVTYLFTEVLDRRCSSRARTP